MFNYLALDCRLFAAFHSIFAFRRSPRSHRHGCSHGCANEEQLILRIIRGVVLAELEALVVLSLGVL